RRSQVPTYLSPGVYVEEVPSSSQSLSPGATAVAAFVGFTAKAPDDDPSDPEGLKPRLVTSWTQFEQLYGGFAPGCMLPHSVYGYFNNGGALAYIVRVPNAEPSGQPAQRALPAADRALGQPIEITSVEPDADLTVAVAPGPEPEDGGEPSFNRSVLERGEVVESYEGLTLGKGDTNAETVVNAASERVKVAVKLESDVDLTEMMSVLKPGAYQLEKAPPTPVPVSGKAFAGSETARSGIGGLVIADDVTMVMVPDLVTAATKEDGSIDLGMWKSVQTALITHCELQANRMASLDAPPGMGVQDIKEWRSEVAMYDSAFAAMYYPWIKVENPIGSNGDTEILVPPSGHMARVWARTDSTRGVSKAPANEIVRVALDNEQP